MEISILEDITKIRFVQKGKYSGDEVTTLESFMCGGLHIGNDSNEFNGSVRIENKEHAKNLIKALEFAIKLGWLGE